MNEQVIALANKANEEIGYNFKLEDAKAIHELMAKFAELIVKECISQVDKSNYNSGDEWDKAMTCAANNIKEHFGVEE